MVLIWWLVAMGEAAAFGPGGAAPSDAGEMLLMACLLGCVLIIPITATSLCAFLVSSHRSQKNSSIGVAAGFGGSLLSLGPSYFLASHFHPMTETVFLGLICLGAILGAFPGLWLLGGETAE